MAADTTNRLLPIKLNGSTNRATGLMAIILLAISTVTASAAMITNFPRKLHPAHLLVAWKHAHRVIARNGQVITLNSRVPLTGREGRRQGRWPVLRFPVFLYPFFYRGAPDYSNGR